MNTNPNLKNPLAFFALCLVVIESIFVALLMYRVDNIVLCPCMVKALFIFIIAFPLIVFIGFYVLLIKKPEVLFSPYENALAEYITNNMSKEEKQNYHRIKDIQYGESHTTTKTKEKTAIPTISEEEILDKYISQNAPFMQKNLKIVARNGARYFDGYANWNGCNYVAEVKKLLKWSPASIQGVCTFVSNARSCFSILHMTLLLSIEEQYSKEEVTKAIHQVDSAVNVVFVENEDGNVTFSNIY